MTKVESFSIEAHLFREVPGGIEFLLLKRSENEIYPGLWQMVTGSVMQNETAFRAALREIREETGLTPERFWIVPHINSFYLPEKDCVCMVPVFAGLVSGNAEVFLSEEHVNYKWLNGKESKKILAWEGQRKSIDIIEEYYLNQKSALKFVDLTDKINLY